ncbi:hypothetical protein NBRC10513_006213 [Rhodotorula toruloides]
MATTASFPTAFRPGKAPLLVDSSPPGLDAFKRSARLFFLDKKIEKDGDKIAYVGAGLVGFPELHNWYLASATTHEAKEYKVFLGELLKRAMPRDYVWDIKAKIRFSKQGDRDYEDWADEMRMDQLSLGDRVLSSRDFDECLLFNMDRELSGILRRGTALANTGFHSDDQVSLALGLASTVIASVDYEAFDREARDEWARIAARRASNAAQLRSFARKATSSSSSGNASNSRSTSSSKSTVNRSAGNSSAPPPSSSSSSSRIMPLTDREKDWLRENKGCFKCRKHNVDHSAPDCEEWPAPGYVVPVPADWQPTKAWRSSSSHGTSSSSAAPRATVGAVKVDCEVDIPESLAFGSDSESDGYALPPLSLRIGSRRSDKLARTLGLVRRRLAKPLSYRLAIKGEEGVQYITEFVRVRIGLANGAWEAGETTLLVAPLEEPFSVILGAPFLRQHRIAISLYPDPQLLIEQAPPLEPIDLYADVEGPRTQLEALEELDHEDRDEMLGTAMETLIARVEAQTDEEKEMAARNEQVMADFADVFPDVLPALTKDYLERTTTRHRIKLVDTARTHNQRGFNVPRKWRERWKKMLDEHIAAGRLRPSTSPFASAAFIIPKKDLDADPRWVNDYRALNSNTVKNRTPLPVPDVVLADAALARYWGKIDLTNAFFQTPMHPDDIEKTAIKTPWGLFEWTVMPQGLCNAPATHQARINEALRHLVGVCCQAFVDDVIIYSASLDEHERNCRLVLEALRKAGLYCSRKKTELLTLRTESLGHIISREGIEADPSKVEKVRNWSRPRTVSQVRGFLGLVQYLRKFIPSLAEHTAVLTPLTRKGFVDVEGSWGEREEKAFEAIKRIVTSLPVLRPVDQDSDEPIWLMTDASKVGIGAVLLQGKDWRTAHPCGFYSRQYIPAERNYPTHEQELLAVVAAMKAWRLDLLGVKFRVLTDHDTLKHFKTQLTLSKRQACWTETLADYDYDLAYIPGKQNAVADSLSRFSFSDEPVVAVCGISAVSLHSSFVERVVDGYKEDAFCVQLEEDLASSPGFSKKDGLLYFEEERLVVPKVSELREAWLHDAHDALGHFGAQKTLHALSQSFYWPGMAKDTVRYVRSCDGCQRHKSRTTRRAGKLHPLPVPPRPFSDVALDFVGPLPTSNGKDMLLTVTDRLSGYTRLVACRSKDGAEDVANLVFDEWIRFFGAPQRLVSDRDKLFVSKFWRSIHGRMGIKLQLSTAFHPETDGRSERTNKTVIQVLRQYVSRRQKDWTSHLSTVEYAINCAKNDSTGLSPFEVVLGFQPSSSPSGVKLPLPSVEWTLETREQRIKDARDALAAAKVRQAAQANKKRGDEPTFSVGDLVMVDSSDRRSRYKTRSQDARAAKLFARWDGPYEVVECFPDSSTYRLNLPFADRSHPVFHASKLKAYHANDVDDFPARELPRPEPMDVEGEEEYIVEAIVDEKGRGRSKKYLVKWRGYPESENTWEGAANVEDTEALDVWVKRKEEGEV